MGLAARPRSLGPARVCSSAARPSGGRAAALLSAPWLARLGPHLDVSRQAIEITTLLLSVFVITGETGEAREKRLCRRRLPPPSPA